MPYTSFYSNPTSHHRLKPLKEKLVLLKETSGANFGIEATGALSVTRLLQNNPYWLNHTGQFIEVKKTLLFDPGLFKDISAHFTRADEIILIERMRELQKMGFKCYIPKRSDDDIHFSLLDPLDSVDFLSLKFKVNALENLESLISPLGLNDEECFLFQDEDIYQLMDGDQSDWAHLDDFQTVDLTGSNISLNNLHILLAEHHQSINSLNLSGCLNLHWEPSSSMSFPQLSLKKLIIGKGPDQRHAAVSQSLLEALIGRLEHVTELHIEIKGMHFDLASIKAPGLIQKLYLNSEVDKVRSSLVFSNLSILDLSDSNIDTETLAAILSSTNQLKELNLANCPIDLPANLNLSALEYLDLSGTNITAANLTSILKKTSKLVHLDLRRCQLQGDFPESFELPHLNHLNLDEANLSERFLTQLFESTPKFKFLTLVNQDFQYEQVLKKLDLSQLETFNSGFSVLSKENLAQILQTSKKLRSLTLSVFNTEKLFNLQNNQIAGYPVLEHLDLTILKAKPEQIYKLLDKQPHLKHLSLHNAVLDSEDIPPSLDLSQLQDLTLNFTKISSYAFDTFITKATQLKRLSLQRMEFTGPLTKFCDFTQLLYADLSWSKTSSTDLVKILSKSIHLKSFKFGAPDAELKSVFPINLNFKQLEKVDLYSLKLNEDNMSMFLTARLKTLLIKHGVISGSLPNDLHLVQLEALNLNGTEISLSNLKKILKCAKNLKRLSLVDVTFTKKEQAALLDFIKQHLPSIEISSINLGTRTSRLESFSFETSNCVVDANTRKDSNQKFEIERVFFSTASKHHPNPAGYRMQVYNIMQVSETPCYINNVFSLTNNSNLQLRPPKNIISSVDKIEFPQPTQGLNNFYARHSMIVSPDWKALPSLSPDEVMLRYHINRDISVDIQRSERDSLYYIRALDETIQIDIEFLIEVPISSNSLLPEAVEKLVQKCRNFKQQALTLPGDISGFSGKDYLKALGNQEVGACRHRTIVFKAWMDEQFSQYPVRIINNKCHSFTEVQYNGNWIRCDLGGYPAELVITNPPLPKIAALKAIKMAPVEIVSLDRTATAVTKSLFFSTPKCSHEEVNAKQFILKLLNGTHASYLLQFNALQALSGFREQVMNHCQSSRRSFFYVDKPNDLICSTSSVQLINGQGKIIAKSSPIARFLLNHKNPVLIVNYNNFTARDIARFNALLDPKPSADSMTLPPDSLILGLNLPQQKTAYNGADFYSRFDEIIYPPQAACINEVLNRHTDKGSSKDAELIDLFDGEDWESHLIGRWDLDGTDLIFVEGSLIKALNKQKNTVILSNAPWENDAFSSFWQKALITREIDCYGHILKLPENFSIEKKEGYNLEALSRFFIKGTTKNFNFTLNPSTFSLLFQQYELKTNHLTSLPGIFERYQGKPLHLYLSHSLTESDWGRIKSVLESLSYERIELTIAWNVTVPSSLNSLITSSSKVSVVPWSGAYEGFSYCQSHDLDVTLGQLKQKNPSLQVLDCSEISPGYLLGTISGGYDVNSQTFYFNEISGLLNALLKENVPIVLKGVFSLPLQQYLSAWIQAHIASKCPVLILSELYLTGLTIPHFLHKVNSSEKKALLQEEEALYFLEEDYQKYSLSQLNTLARYKRMGLKEPWIGMEHLPTRAAITYELSESVDIELSSLSFDQKRYNEVVKVLATSPFVFLAGATGVGKTTFMQKTFKSRNSLYQGEELIGQWAEAGSVKGYITLFIDEANISTRQWSEFEGLFESPPFVIINHSKKTLTPRHKVVFAGNPLSYGDERQQPSLFKRHGNSVLFEPLSGDYLAHNVLYPAIKELKRESLQPILNVAAFLTNLSRDIMLITPRELSMMALLAENWCKSYGINDLSKQKEVAQYYAYHFAKSFVPNAHQAQFEEKFKTDIQIEQPRLQNSQLIINNANQQAYQRLIDFLSVRNYRIENPSLKGGLGGLILEGEPGAGKSELVIETLVAQGFREGSLDSHSLSSVPHFYRMPVSMPLSEKKALLCRAFYEGSIIIVDEINAAPMMERFLNALLMGELPEDEDNVSQIESYKLQEVIPKPGFLLLGTQNPSTMRGRGKMSEALIHRTHTVQVLNYTRKELEQILIAKGLDEDSSRKMVSEYLTFKPFDKSLCFRDLIKRSAQYIKARTSAATRLEEAPRDLEPDPLYIESATTRTVEQQDLEQFTTAKLEETLATAEKERATLKDLESTNRIPIETEEQLNLKQLKTAKLEQMLATAEKERATLKDLESTNRIPIETEEQQNLKQFLELPRRNQNTLNQQLFKSIESAPSTATIVPSNEPSNFAPNSFKQQQLITSVEEEEIVRAMNKAIKACSLFVSGTSKKKELLETLKNKFQQTEEEDNKLGFLRSFIDISAQARSPFMNFFKAKNGFTASATAFYAQLKSDSSRAIIAEALSGKKSCSLEKPRVNFFNHISNQENFAELINNSKKTNK